MGRASAKRKAREQTLLEQEEQIPEAYSTPKLIQRGGYQHQAIPAPTFDGTGNVDQFITTFEAIAQHNGWAKEEKGLRLQLALKGPASRGAQGDTCEKVYEKLQSQYGLTEDTANTLLRNLKLKPKENAHQFGEKVLTLVQKAYPLLSSEQQDHQAKQEVIYAVASVPQLAWTLRLTPPASLSDALEVIHKYFATAGTEVGLHRLETEEVKEIKQQLNKQAEDFKASQNDMMEKFMAMQTSLSQQLVETQKQMVATQREFLTGSSRRGDQRNRPVKCYNCQELGHIARNCPRPKKTGNAVGQEM